MKILKNLVKVTDLISTLFRSTSVHMKCPKMYVLVRKDFAEIYRAVQGGHALAAYALKYPIEFRVW